MAILTTMTIGAKIRKLRKGLRLSQVELGKLTGIHQSRISEVENGEGSFAHDQVAALADALKTTASYLVDENQLEPPVQPTGEIERLVWQAVKDLGWEESWRRLLGKPIRTISTEVVRRGEIKTDEPRGDK